MTKTQNRQLTASQSVINLFRRSFWTFRELFGFFCKEWKKSRLSAQKLNLKLLRYNLIQADKNSMNILTFSLSLDKILETWMDVS